MERRSVKLSVIIPQALSDPRARFEYVESWCRQLGVPAGDYEIVVAVNARHESAIQRCRTLVRPQDQVIAFHGENEMHYYEAGIEVARGQLLLLTEDHVVADEHCVGELLKFFEQTSASAAFLRAEHINHNHIGRNEGQFYDRQVKNVWLQPGCWDKVHLRAFVIDRDVLASMGGVPWEYGLFCPRLLSLYLRRAAIPIAYCSDAVVNHVNLWGLKFLQYEIGSYVHNEYRFRDEQHSPDDQRDLGVSAVLEQREIWKNNLIGTAAAQLGKAFRHNLTWRMGRSALSLIVLVTTALRWRLLAMAGPRGLVWLSRIKYSLCWLRYYVLRNSKTRGNFAFERLWGAMADMERADYCVAHPDPPDRFDSTLFGEGSRFIGFHDLEYWQGQPFRWSEPVSMLSLSLSVDDYEICIDTGGIRGADCRFRFELFFNERRIDPTEIDINGGCIRFRVSADGIRVNTEQLLLILTQPVPIRKGTSLEARRLGMPVRAVTCEAAAQIPARELIAA